jgi:hypothetical protein
VLLVSLLALGLAGGLELSGFVGGASAPGFAVAAAVAVAVAPGAVAVAVAVVVAWTCCTLGWLVWVVGPAVGPAVVGFWPVVGVEFSGANGVLASVEGGLCSCRLQLLPVVLAAGWWWQLRLLVFVGCVGF